MTKNNFTIVCIVFYVCLRFNAVFAIDVILTSAGTTEKFTIDSFNQDNKEYIHLPTLIMKLNGILDIEENKVDISLREKNITINFQSALINFYDGMVSKIIQLREPLKLWQDTIWIELNDARLLVKTISEKDLSRGDLTKIEGEEQIESKYELQPISTEGKEEKKVQGDIEENEKTIFEEIVGNEKQEDIKTKKEQIQNIVIDAGHGGDDNGILLPSGKYEKEINLLIAKELEQQLTKKGIKTELLRREDKKISNEEKISILRGKNDVFYISIHTGLPKRTNTIIYVFQPLTSNEVLGKITDNYTEMLIANLGIIKEKELKTGKFYTPSYIASSADVPAIFLEIYPSLKENSNEENWNLFIGTEAEFAKIFTEAFLQWRANNKSEKDNE